MASAEVGLINLAATRSDWQSLLLGSSRAIDHFAPFLLCFVYPTQLDSA